MSLKSYFLGCPIWANRDWLGRLYPRSARSDELLGHYASVFNTVEGNPTFHGLPRPETVQRWRQQMPMGFLACFKFPRRISHELQLVGARADTREFLATIVPLYGRLGVLFLQLPPSFGPDALPALASYLEILPVDFHYAVEVRHPDFAAGLPGDQALNRLLEDRFVNRVIFHTETLHQLVSDDPAIREAQRQKPRLATAMTATAQRPFIRFVGSSDVEPNREPLRRIARQTATWLRAGKTPFLFMHTPDDVHCPELCRLFHGLLQEVLGGDGPAIGDLPPWPGESELYQPTLF